MTIRKIMIHSDGYGGSGTVILDDDGKLLEGVTGIDLHIEAQRVNEATVYLDMVQVNSEAKVDRMIFRCPLCGWEGPEHNCDHTLGQTGASTQLPLVVPQPQQSVPIQVMTPGGTPTWPQSQVVWNPTLPIEICGVMNGSETCRILTKVGAHSMHVNTETGAVWSDQYRQITVGNVHHA